jgi:hypothetical protein
MRVAPAYHTVSYVMPTSVLDRIAVIAARLRLSDQDIIRLAVEAYDPPASVIPEPEPQKPAPGFNLISERMFELLNTPITKGTK